MRKLVIAIDCDDVLLAAADKLIAAYNREYGTALTPEYYYGPATVQSWGTDDVAVAVERVERFQLSPEYSLTQPHHSAVEVVRRLARFHDLHLVTGRPDHLQETTMSTLDKYFPGCFSTIECTNLYNEKRRSKGEVCVSLGADILIDDHLPNCKSVLEHGLREVILFGDFPWNRTDELPKGVIRCKNWLAVEKEIERIAHE